MSLRIHSIPLPAVSSNYPVQLSKPIFICILLVLLPAFLVNLGIPPFIDDEGNRALVAMEMQWSGNYITPTLHGSYYYNKPPLWNWILSASFWLHGGPSEWAARFPSVLALLGYALTVFALFRQYIGTTRAALAALMLLTCGRIIFWESLLGLIDIFFSWIVFVQLFVIFHFGQRRRWWLMFGSSYVLMSIAFLLKGLPAIAFQGITLVVWLAYSRQFWRLFSIPHIISGVGSVAILSIYYYCYHQYNDLSNVFTTLFVESGKRTAVAYGWLDTLKHIAEFPLQFLYHFLPWSLMIFLLLFRSVRQRVWQQPVVVYAIIIGLANVVLYWLSPNFYPRYILMLLPFAWLVFIQAYPDNVDETIPKWMHITFRIIGYLFLATMLVGSIAPLFVPDAQYVSLLQVKVVAISLTIGAVIWAYRKFPQQQFFILALGLLVFRFGFNLFVLPPRGIVSSKQVTKASSQAFAERWQGESIAVFADNSMEPACSYYLETTFGDIIPRHLSPTSTGQWYIFNPDQYDRRLFHPIIDSFKVRHNHLGYYLLGRPRTVHTDSIKLYTLAPPPGF